MEPEWVNELKEAWDAHGPEAVLTALEGIVTDEYGRKTASFAASAEELALYNDTANGLHIVAKLWQGFAPKENEELSRVVFLEEEVICPMCGGDGTKNYVANPGTDSETCDVCEGKGRVPKP